MESPQHERPLWVGFALATIAPWLCVTLVMAFSMSETGTVSDVVVMSLISAFVALPMAGAAMLLFGVPYILWLRAYHRLNVYTVCVGSSLIGPIVFVVFSLLPTVDGPPPLAALVAAAGFGLASGLAFCLGSGPNNSFKPKPLRGSA